MEAAGDREAAQNRVRLIPDILGHLYGLDVVVAHRHLLLLYVLDGRCYRPNLASNLARGASPQPPAAVH
jgi:hypothetical protein